jgi:hypothetical protein
MPWRRISNTWWGILWSWRSWSNCATLLRPVQIQCLLLLFLHLGIEELGPMWAMMATGAGLSLVLNLY